MDNQKGIYETNLLNFGKQIGVSNLNDLIEFKKIDVDLKSVCIDIALERRKLQPAFLENCLERAYLANQQFNEISGKL